MSTLPAGTRNSAFPLLPHALPPSVKGTLRRRVSRLRLHPAARCVLSGAPLTAARRSAPGAYARSGRGWACTAGQP